MLWLDDALGRVLDELEARGTLDDTLIVFVSDHDRRGKFVLNGGRVPLMMRWPGHIQPDTEIDALVSLIDLLPTLLELTGRPTDDARLQIVSFAPLLDGRAAAVREDAFMEVTYTRGVVTPEFKYIATRFPDRIAQNLTPENRRRINQEGTFAFFGDPDGDIVRYRKDLLFPAYFDDDQLYDLTRDPDEQVNVAADPAYAEALAHMKRRLAAYIRQTPHPFGEFGRRGDGGGSGE
ncbi:MAG: sulfatase/phosphatase domain-containing protein [Planctomycetota bacterium]